jgi:hypothetical protein
MRINAEVVTHVAGSLEAEGLPGYPQMLICWNKCDEVLKSSLSLYWTQISKTQGLKLYTKRLNYWSENKYVCTGRRLASKS